MGYGITDRVHSSSRCITPMVDGQLNRAQGTWQMCNPDAIWRQLTRLVRGPSSACRRSSG